MRRGGVAASDAAIRRGWRSWRGWTDIHRRSPRAMRGCVHLGKPGDVRGRRAHALKLASPPRAAHLKTRRNDRMSTSITRRGVTLLAAGSISLFAALATASQAGAATYYACIKKN